MGSPTSVTDIPSLEHLANIQNENFRKLIVEKGMRPEQAAAILDERSMAVR